MTKMLLPSVHDQHITARHSKVPSTHTSTQNCILLALFSMDVSDTGTAPAGIKSCKLLAMAVGVKI